jgi:hypothetical protein
MHCAGRFLFAGLFSWDIAALRRKIGWMRIFCKFRAKIDLPPNGATVESVS